MSLRAGRQEADSVNVPQAVVGLVAAGGLVVATIIGVYATTHNINWTAAGTASIKNEPTTPPKFGMLHQTLFGAHSDHAEVKNEQLQLLETYGWVDEEKGLAHIPIEVAKRRVLEGRAK